MSRGVVYLLHQQGYGYGNDYCLCTDRDKAIVGNKSRDIVRVRFEDMVSGYSYR